ncbi:unnamed protein product [Alopecurus aequalis]
MSSFTGMSTITGGKHCTTTAVDAGTDSGYHILVVKDYSRTVQEIPNGEDIGTGPFIVGGHKWSIKYCANGHDQNSADFISIYICLDDVDIEEAVKVHAVFTFADAAEYKKPMYIRAYEPRNFSSEAPAWGCKKFIKRDVLERSVHLKEDCFTIWCGIMAANDLNTQQDIGQHFKILLQDKLGSDVTFEVGSELFPAHRCVLAARSKVFKAQLFGPMAEGITSSVIQIKDMEANVFAALLSFIYKDLFLKMEEDTDMEEEEQVEEEAVEVEIPDVEEEGQEEEAADHVTALQWRQDLFVAADKFDILQLKFLCERKLSENIDVSSVASTLALAEQHHCHGLKETCFKFIKSNLPSVWMK